MKLFVHYLYQYKKGLRRLVLHTVNAEHEAEIIRKLEKNKIDYIIQKVNQSKINVFFGNPYCISVLREFGDFKLSDLSDEKDFMLGIMLGYNLVNQCERYMGRKKHYPKKALQLAQ